MTSRRARKAVTGGGLAAWRSIKGGCKGELPTLTLPIEELLLPGYTKQMHLYDAGQVDSFDVAQSRYCGLLALVYVVSSSDSKQVLSFATVAETTAFTSLDAAGRIITLRSVGRVHLDGISTVVSSVGGWGAAMVEEIPEICSGDDQLVEQAIKELTQFLASQDILQPGMEATLAGPSLADPAHAEENEENERPNGLRPCMRKQDIEGGSIESRWDEWITHIAQTLSGVPLSSEEHIAVVAWSRMLAGVALLYGLLGSADLATRVEYFTMPDQILTARLRYMLEMLREKQGMARARHAIATVFDSANTEDDGNLLGKLLPPESDRGK